MNVLIDSGNSRIKVACSRPESAGPEPVAVFEKDALQSLRHWAGRLSETPVAVFGVNVAGARQATAIGTALDSLGGWPAVRWLTAQARALGLTNGYDAPHSLGPDRWVSMIGVRHRIARSGTSRNAFVLATFGTATTIDSVSADGVFHGGLILPGVTMMRQALASGTANLVPTESACMDFPTATGSAIASGVAAAQAGAVLRQWLLARVRYGDGVMLVPAGGGWPQVRAETERLLREDCVARRIAVPRIMAVEHPVLDGLAQIATESEPPGS